MQTKGSLKKTRLAGSAAVPERKEAIDVDVDEIPAEVQVVLHAHCDSCQLTFSCFFGGDG